MEAVNKLTEKESAEISAELITLLTEEVSMNGKATNRTGEMQVRCSLRVAEN